MGTEFDRTSSIQELLEQDFVEAEDGSSLIGRVHRLWHTPLGDFGVEDLRTMIGQNLALEYLIPLAVERLHENPLTGGDYYPCDLLASVLTVDRAFWLEHPDLWLEMNEIVVELEGILETIKQHLLPEAEEIRKSIRNSGA